MFKECFGPLYHGVLRWLAFCQSGVSPSVCLGVHISFGDHFVLFSALAGLKTEEKSRSDGFQELKQGDDSCVFKH